MLRDITLGQYYQTDSILHRLDPRVKLAGTFVYLISLFLFKNITVYIVAILFLGCMIRLAKIPFRFIARGLRPVIILLLITAGFNLFLTPGEKWLQLWTITISKEGVSNAFYTVLRLILLIFGSSLLTLTTTPNRLTDGLEKSLKPLETVKVPVHEIAMMISIALRFIPILMEETDKIMKAQLARGADFESGNFVRKIKALVPILIPLFVSAFRRANDLAMAMEARCYRGGEGRTKMKPLKYAGRDIKAYFMLAGYLTLVIVIGKCFPIHVII
ncbi:MAG: energy-coupling factor transporter transmembrane protein EcfT [Lachnospiraceae bacterium]|nr:energy-coupling factor transporter transmembrane protein EcfT [Lachnospiraceae bacterium]